MKDTGSTRSYPKYSCHKCGGTGVSKTSVLAAGSVQTPKGSVSLSCGHCDGYGQVCESCRGFSGKFRPCDVCGCGLPTESDEN